MAKHGVLPSKISTLRHHLPRYRLSEKQTYNGEDQLRERTVSGDASITAFRAISKTTEVGLKYLTLFKTLSHLEKIISVVV